MLRFLKVRHLAVIEQVEVEFGPGFNVLTGETGAGKSILVEGIGLLVGGRASSDLVRTGEDAASVQAVFDGPGGEELIIRREITAQGRSRAFVNDDVVTTTALRELGRRLVGLHGQHEHQQLVDPASHLAIVDAFGALDDARASVGTRWQAWREAQAALDRTKMDARERAARIELVSFQLDDIEKTSPKAGEDDTLAAERLVLGNAERLTRLSAEAYTALYDGESAALASLGTVWKRLAELSDLDPRFAPYLDARAAIKSQLEDLAFFLRSYAGGIDASPARLQHVEDRLSALERLKRKHGPGLDDVLARAAALRAERDALMEPGGQAGALEQRLAGSAAAYLQGASALSASRRTAAAGFSKRLVAALGELAMARTRCELRFDSAPSDQARWTSTGIDSGEIFLSPNPGEDPKPLARIASGGELSRIMLALKTIATADAPGRTLIFDEVDAGIGGAVADVVGAKLKALAGRDQVLCITHLPQIAARADRQFAITKTVRGSRTVTDIRHLDAAAREREIARMIGGDSVTPQLLQSAQEMIAARQAKDEQKAKGESESRRKKPRGA
ncbi:MAG: DNA repair protein RecN [Acidobacteriota bacterium]|nr:DNA repair protein RecN [Acidobacteriota bacterium]